VTDGSDSARLVHHLTEVGETVACAESLTAGLLAAAIADTPGASLVLRGGVVAYAADLKVALLGVDAALIAEAGTVDPRVAVAMAEGVRDRLESTWGLSTTGVAGPGPAEGKPEGTVHIAVSGPAGTVTRELRLDGGRAEIRRRAVLAVLALAADQAGAVAETTGTASDPRGTVGDTGPTTDGTTRRTT
jgi:nicotinamide-nucleotide amidase